MKKAFFERLSLSISQNSSLEFMPEWMEDNTANPSDTSKGWSFAGHEFQIDILKSTSHRQSVKKCSQVGLSELAARKALALATLRQGIQLIYTLPTGAFAQMFAKTRIDPIIESSAVLSNITDKDTNNTKLKKIGTSFIHFVGTYSSSSPISIPASYVISDEVDFSDQAVLTEFNSRLGHQKVSESFNIKFSTPTVDGYSISAEYELSSKARYAVKCKHCNSWQIPNFLDDVVIPSATFDLHEVTRFDIASLSNEELGSSYLSCPSCKKDLMPSLLDKSCRQWVHEHPDRQKYHEGFHVVPYDVPSVNPVSRTLSQILDYQRIASWYNFKLGETYSDNTTKFNLDIVSANTVITNSEGAASAIVAADIGKTSWISVGIPYTNQSTGDVEQLDVIALYRVDSTRMEGDNTVGKEIIRIANKYTARVVLVDAAPDFTTAQHVSKMYIAGSAYGNYYVNDSTFAKEMSHWKLDERKGVCLSARTASLDNLCEYVNAGRVKFPVCDEMATVRVHLDSMKRVEDGVGSAARWVKREKAEDHWTHSLNYLLLAAEIAGGGGAYSAFELVPSIRPVRLKTPSGLAF